MTGFFMRQIFICCILLVLIWSCRNKDKQAAPVAMEEEEELMDWKENDTLRLSSAPMGLRSWLGYYGKADTGFRLANFKASSVVLHFGGLEDAATKGDEQTLKDYFIWSPDSSRYLDLFSYDHFMDKGVLVDGEADQQVGLVHPSMKINKQLLFNGPSQSAEFADWLNNDAFLIGLRSTSEDGRKLDFQLLVFRLSDSTFTNFNLDHAVSVDSVNRLGQGFSESYTNKLGKQ